MNNPTKVAILNAILEENDIVLENENSIEEGDKVTKKDSKIQLFTDLATETEKQYPSELGEIRNLFQFPLTKIENWKSLITKPESNVGKQIEQVLINYANGIQTGVAEKATGKGVDIKIDGRPLEVKSSEDISINTILQSSFYADDPNKFYAFASNTSGKDLNIRIVSSQLLYNNALGEELIKSLQLNQDDNLLTQAIENGLNDLNFPEMIKSSLTTGKVNTDTKSFKIGKIRVRFILNISTD
jgi:hypothetical protein